MISEYFFPQSTGGTELYVYNLAKVLINLGNEVSVLTCSTQETSYNYNQLSVYTIPFNKTLDKRVITNKTPADNLDTFISTITSINPDIIHFHTLTTSISLFHIEKAKDLGYPVAITSHIPGHICLRGDLLLKNKVVCDGLVEEQKCLSCYYHSKGIHAPLNTIMSFLTRKLDFLEQITNAAKNKINFFSRISNCCDAIIVVSEWQRLMFLSNGFSPTRLHVCRQAIDQVPIKQPKAINEIFTIGFIGRITQVKGLHVLLSALECINETEFHLKIVGLPQPDETAYFQGLKKRASKFTNCTWLDSLPNSDVPDFLSSLDVLCVPSLWLETGPFVAYESLAVKTPVLGTNIGGLREIIKENENGWLFEFNNPESIKNRIIDLIKKHKRKEHLEIKVTNTRITEEMGREMMFIYAKMQLSLPNKIRF